MAVRIIRAPVGATPRDLCTWASAVQKVADEQRSEVEVRSRDDDGKVIALCVATPRSRLERLFGR